MTTAAPWVGPVGELLLGAVAAEAADWPAWLKSEPPGVQIGFLRGDALRAARLACIEAHGLHAFIRWTAAAIRDPEGLAAMLAAPPPIAPDLAGAAYLHLQRRLGDLELFLTWLARQPGLGSEDLDDLLGLWGDPESRVERLVAIVRGADPAVAALAVRALAGPALRGFVRPWMELLAEIVEAHEHPDMAAVFVAAFG